jgi:5-methylthioribose kinase
MMMAESRITQDPYFNQIWENFTSNAFAVWINGSEHYSFTDVGILLNHLLPAIPPKLLGFGDIDPKRMVNITRSIELAFFETYLKTSPINSLEEALLMFPEIIFKSKS